MSKWDDTREARFWSKVDRSGTCWLWTGTKTKAGYGQIRVRGSKMYAHRYSYDLANPGATAGTFENVLHSCDTPACVNPAHLSAGTQKENMAGAAERGRLNPWMRNALACRRGHAFSPENTSILPSGSRRCLTCHREANRKTVVTNPATRTSRNTRGKNG